MSSIQAVLLHFLHISLGLLGFVVLGLFAYPILKSHSKSARITLLASIGYLMTLTSTYIVSKITTKVVLPLVIFYVLTVCAGAVVWYLSLASDSKRWAKLFSARRTNLISKDNLIYSIPIFASIVPVIIPLIKFAQPNYMVPTFTQGNNDVAQFVLASEAILRGGFLGEEFVINQSQFVFARDNDFGAPNFLLWASKFIFSESWIAVTPSISIVSLLLFLSTAGAICARFNFDRGRSYAIAFLASSGAVVLYLSANIFLSQVISMWLWGNIILLVSRLKMCNSLSEKRSHLILIGVNFAATFFTYPHMALIGFGVFTASMIFWNTYSKESSKKRRNIQNNDNVDFSLATKIIIPAIVVLLACNVYLLPGMRLFIFRASSSNGWPMPDGFSIANILFIGDYSGKFQSFFEVISLIFLTFWFLISYQTVKKRKKSRGDITEIFLWTAIPVTLYLILSVLFGPSSYKAWKVLFSFTPMILASLFSTLTIRYFKTNNKRFWTVFVIGLSLVLVPMLRQSMPIVQNSALYGQRVSSPDLYNLNVDLKKYNLKDINIQLNPFFESMYAAAIIQIPSVHIVSPSYVPIVQNMNTCTLVRNDSLRNLEKNYSRIEKVSSTYSIINYPNNCLKIQTKF